MLPAVGQGALAMECRTDDAATQAAVAPLDDFRTHAAVVAERALLRQLRGGCMAPVGALAELRGNELNLSATVLSTNGDQRLFAHDASSTINSPSAEALGHRVAEILLAQGAAKLIANART
jgi:hydroxymethylbilane synthase